MGSPTCPLISSDFLRIHLHEPRMGKFWPSQHLVLCDGSLTLQGAPETGDIPNAMPKPTTIEVKPESLEYGPTGGTKVIDQSPYILKRRHFVPL
jgi:hypothetical protein